MKLVVGLGNPGKKYKDTRHNVGFILLDKYAEDNSLEWSEEKKFKSQITKQDDTIFAKPQTFMNKSGEAVSKLVNFYQITPEDLVVIHDDVDLEFGAIKDQVGRGDAGHKGVADIVEKLGTQNFRRIRVGVGKPTNPEIDTEAWVLKSFAKDEYSQLLEIVPTFI
jgi:peptidyl-tRNA hydrolase, PTH1 family